MRPGCTWMFVPMALLLGLTGCRLKLPGDGQDAAPPAPDAAASTDGAPTDAATPDAAVPLPDAAVLLDAALPDAGPDAAAPLECFPAGPPSCDPGIQDPAVCFTDPTPCYATVLQEALAWAYADHPEWFEPGFEYQPGQTCDRLVDQNDYVAQISDRLVTTAGLCAAQSPWAGDCIGIKHDNAFDECYDLVAHFTTTSGDEVPCRRTNVANMYCDSCAPAYQ